MGTRLIEAVSFEEEIVVPNPDEGIRAGGGIQTPISLYGADPNGEIIYTGLVKDVRVCHLGGISKTLLATTSGNDVMIQLGTDASGFVLSTVNEVIAEIRSKPAVTKLLTASLPIGSTGKGLVGVYGFVHISAGERGSIRIPFQKITNRSRYLFTVLEDLMLGKTTVASLEADLKGKQPATPVPGRVKGEFLQAQPDYLQNSKIFGNKLAFFNVGVSDDANPPHDTMLQNELRPINIIKSWGRIETDGKGGYNVLEGCNFAVTLNPAFIQITMKKPMISKDAYVVLPGLEYTPGAGSGHGWIQPKNIDASTFIISIYPPTGGFTNPENSNVVFNFGICGKQQS